MLGSSIHMAMVDQLTVAGMTVTNDGTVTTFLGKTGDYNRVGDAGTTAHSLNSEDDWMVSGDFEVKGTSWFDGNVGFFGATAQAQQSHIVDADGTLSDITTKFNTLLSYLDADAGFGLIAGA